MSSYRSSTIFLFSAFTLSVHRFLPFSYIEACLSIIHSITYILFQSFQSAATSLHHVTHFFLLLLPNFFLLVSLCKNPFQLLHVTFLFLLFFPNLFWFSCLLFHLLIFLPVLWIKHCVNPYIISCSVIQNICQTNSWLLRT